jgi:hypothetical protein
LLFTAWNIGQHVCSVIHVLQWNHVGGGKWRTGKST